MTESSTMKIETCTETVIKVNDLAVLKVLSNGDLEHGYTRITKERVTPLFVALLFFYMDACIINPANAQAIIDELAGHEELVQQLKKAIEDHDAAAVQDAARTF
jgi:hypothetical protein